MKEDYIHRNTKKKSNPRRALKKRSHRSSGSSRKPTNRLWTMITVAAFCSTGFAWFLFSLAKQPDPLTTEKAVKTPPAVASQTDITQSEPEEKWTYIQRLENKKIDVEPPIIAKTHQYLLQCGTFSKAEQAEAFKAQIALSGLHSEIKPTGENPPKWYRVVLGPYTSKRHAEQDRNLLKDNEIFGCQILLLNNH